MNTATRTILQRAAHALRTAPYGESHFDGKHDDCALVAISAALGPRDGEAVRAATQDRVCPKCDRQILDENILVHMNTWGTLPLLSPYTSSIADVFIIVLLAIFAAT